MCLEKKPHFLLKYSLQFPSPISMIKERATDLQISFNVQSAKFTHKSGMKIWLQEYVLSYNH